ncbi:MAG: SDR family oxidoreductase [Zoogloeaceae bacterium]|nr:SDR family oxidoreductase [Rhodocyclaceae bacterium]MCP5237187.1 SDR family oxidoreductase [Zoogloeaceae bacterium]
MRAIVTGHSRGLGAAICAALLEDGATVLALSRKGNAALAERHGERLREIPIDLADTGQLIALTTAGDWHGFLGGSTPAFLVNNAGDLGPVAAIGRQGGSEIGRAVAINVTAALILGDAFVAATEAATDRRLLHVSSGAARSAYAGWSVYCASKAALDHHARAVERDRVPGLRAASVAPGVIDTDMQAVVRSSTADDFPAIDRFRALHRDGQLQSPSATARRLVDYLQSPSFGAQATADLRDL